MGVMCQRAILQLGRGAKLFNDVEIRSSRSLARTAARIALGIASTLLASMLAVAGLLKIWSYPGRPKPFVDVAGLVLPGSISEKIRIEVNGVAQGMFLKGKDITNPVLLYLHGGMPDYFLAQKHPTGLEEPFTVAWWEQRRSGLSYDRTIPPETMTSEQFIIDTIEVTNYLIFLPSLQCPDYTAAEKINMWRGKFGAGVSYLWNDMMRTDLVTQIPELSLPVYLFHGIHDYTCSYAEAKAYFEILKAPLKGFYTFQQSAHSPIFEEPQKMLNIIQTDVLAGRNSLSDAL
jgi:hypothetical protein